MLKIANASRILDNFSEKGDVIYDPFMGTGTTAVVAKKLGRNYVGYETNKEYIDIANKRLNAQGCLAALTIGFLMGLFRLAIDTPIALFDGFAYDEGTLFWIINNIFFQYYLPTSLFKR